MNWFDRDMENDGTDMAEECRRALGELSDPARLAAMPADARERLSASLAAFVADESARRDRDLSHKIVRSWASLAVTAAMYVVAPVACAACFLETGSPWSFAPLGFPVGFLLIAAAVTAARLRGAD